MTEFFNIFKVSILCPKVALRPRWISDTDSVPLEPLKLNFLFPVMRLQVCQHAA